MSGPEWVCNPAVRYPTRDARVSDVLTWWYVRALVCCVAVAAVAGLIEGIAVYPPASIPAVTGWLAVLGAWAGTVLGLLAGSVALAVRRLRRR